MIRKKVADEILKVRFLPSGKLFGIVRVGDRYRFIYWSLPNFEEELIHETQPLPYAGLIRIDSSVAFCASPDTVAVSFRTRQESFRFIIRGLESLSFSELSLSETSTVSLSQDGQSLVAHDQHGPSLSVWNGSHFEKAKEFQSVPRSKWRNRVVFGFAHTDESLLVWKIKDHCFSLFDAKTSIEICELFEITAHFRNVRLSHDSSTGLFNFGRTLLVVDLVPNGTNQASTKTLTERNPPLDLGDCILHPDKDRVLCSKPSGQLIYLYSLRSNSLIEKYNWAHESISSLDYSYDGLLAACGTAKGKLIVWDVD